MTVSDAPASASTPAAPAAPSALNPVFRELSAPSPLAQTPQEASPRAQRLLSLDVFRGLTMAAMIFVNNIDEDHTYGAFNHAKWNGWTFTDLIFPFFLFIVGVAMPFSLARRSKTTEQTKGQLVGRIWLRALSLWMLGQLLFAWPMPINAADYRNAVTKQYLVQHNGLDKDAGRDETKAAFDALSDADRTSLNAEVVRLEGGFMGTKAMRIVCFVFVYGGILALLIPWRSRPLQIVIPIFVAITFYGMLFVMHYVRARAVAAGWPATVFGNGILNPDRLRIPGVLQRIGLVYGIAGTITLLLGRWWSIGLSIVALCAIYCVLMFRMPYGPDHRHGSLTIDDNLSRYVDVKTFDRPPTQKHTYTNYPDNEGLISSIPAIGTCLLGVLLGLWLRRTDRTPIERGGAMLAMAVPTLIVGWLLDSWLMPINKILWTPSYVFFTAGLAMLVLGFLFWVVDVLGYRKWSVPAVVFGMNAIAAYCAASIVPKMLNLIVIKHGDNEHDGLYAFLKQGYLTGVHHACNWLAASSLHLSAVGSEKNLTVYSALFLVFVLWVLMSILYVCKIFVKV